MTESEWLTSNDPQAMLRLFVGEPHAGQPSQWEPRFHVSDRKLRLWCCAVRMAITSQCHDYDRPEEAYAGVEDATAAWDVDDEVDNCVLWESLPPHAYPEGTCCRPIGMAEKAALLRDIVGNPWRPPADPWVGPLRACPSWDAEAVWATAHAAYDERRDDGTLDPVRLAVLADALEEASCNNREILDHLRNNAVHVRGCWVLDLVLGKE